jgi:hypothetical protein
MNAAGPVGPGEASQLLARPGSVQPLLWLSAHGGSGATTMSAATGLGCEETLLPALDTLVSVPVIVVARTHAHGLLCAQQLAARAASGGLGLATPHHLAGLVLVADAPGKLPKPLAELAHLVSGGYPRTWRVPYVEAWRLGEPPHAANAPKVLACIGQDLAGDRPVGQFPGNRKPGST